MSNYEHLYEHFMNTFMNTFLRGMNTMNTLGENNYLLFKLKDNIYTIHIEIVSTFESAYNHKVFIVFINRYKVFMFPFINYSLNHSFLEVE